MRAALKLALSVLLAFATLIGVMILSQASMLFPTNAVPPAGPLPPGAERLELTSGGERLHGVHIKPSANAGGQRTMSAQSLSPRQARTLILGFGGNAWNGQEVATYLHGVYPEADVVAFHYRGYRPSTGAPSADALKEDAPLIFDMAVDRVKPGRVVAVGLSIGSGVAANLSSRRTLHGLILVTPFDSLKRAAADLFPWLPVGPFLQHELAAAEDLKDSTIPVAILAAERDEIIRAPRTAALRSEVPNLVFDRIISGAGHNDIYHRRDFEMAMHEALKAVVAGKKQP